MKELPVIYLVWTKDHIGYYASRKGARKALEPSFQKHWAQANDPSDRRFGFVWAKRYRELGEQAARNSFMREGITRVGVQP